MDIGEHETTTLPSRPVPSLPPLLLFRLHHTWLWIVLFGYVTIIHDILVERRAHSRARAEKNECYDVL